MDITASLHTWTFSTVSGLIPGELPPNPSKDMLVKTTPMINTIHPAQLQKQRQFLIFH